MNLLSYCVNPIHLHFMVVIHTCPDPIKVLGEEHWNSPAGTEVIEFLLKHELVAHDLERRRLRSTERGAVWIRMMCSTPLPIQKWIDPRIDD